MRDIFLGVAGAAALAVGCTPQTLEEKASRPASFESAMAQYSEAIVQKSKGSITKASAPEQTTDMPSYVVKYTAVNPALLTSKDAATNPSSYARNVGITAAWQQMFCTPALKEILGEFDVAMVSGRLYSAAGESSSMAICMSDL